MGSGVNETDQMMVNIPDIFYSIQTKPAFTNVSIQIFNNLSQAAFVNNDEEMARISEDLLV